MEWDFPDPVATLGWDHIETGSFLALRVVRYGAVQVIAPRLTAKSPGHVPGGRSALLWAGLLAGIPCLIAMGLHAGLNPEVTLVAGLLIFGVVFAVNSSLHSYLIVSYARSDGVSLDVGFYYMANTLGRLAGTLLSGAVYQVAGLEACLWLSTTMLVGTVVISMGLPDRRAL